MLHTWTLENLNLDETWLTIGSFDGVHLGHQKILSELVYQAHTQDKPAVALTFYPHPADVLGKRNGAFYLSSPEEKAEMMSELGLDVLISLPFNNQTARLSAQDFIQRLKQKTRFRTLCIGKDFALGHNREGDINRLSNLGIDMNFSLYIFEPFEMNGRVISSSWIRRALSDGDLSLANSLLGRTFKLSGEVVHGDDRGKTLGFPTANLEIWEKRTLPKIGVYAGMVKVDGQVKLAVINIGHRPTFDNRPEQPRVEAHILGFEGDIYGRQVSVSFIQRLRDEQRFNNIQALIDQIHLDIQEAIRILEVNRHEAIPGLTSICS